MDQHDRDQGRGGWTELTLVIGFLAVLCYPAVSLVRTPKPDASTAENRVLTARPPLSLLIERPHRFARVFKSFFDDQFESRNQLVLLNSFLRYRVLRAASNPMVIPAKHGRLFYAGEATFPAYDMGNEMVQFRRTHPLTTNELENLRDLLERRRRWAEGMGAKFLFVICPDKSTIYSDQVPERFNRLDAPSATDQLIGYLRDTSKVDVLDLRGALFAARRQRPVYLMRDTHWNEYGAFAGYAAIAGRLRGLFPEVVPLEIDRMDSIEITFSGDLTKMLNLGEQLGEKRVILRPQPPKSYFIPFPLDGSPVPTWLERPMAARIEGSKSPKALVYHDSFMYQMIPFLSEHFETAIYIRDPHVTLKTVKGYHPDIVIHECVERLLRSLIGLHDDLRPVGETNLRTAGNSSAAPARR
jgi:alginate O-acetyltransferase complex protein AlgJ